MGKTIGEASINRNVEDLPNDIYTSRYNDQTFVEELPRPPK